MRTPASLLLRTVSTGLRSQAIRPTWSPVASTSYQPSTSSPPLAVHSIQITRHYASKKKGGKASGKRSSGKSAAVEEEDDEIEVETHPVPVLAKGKKAKAAQKTEEDEIEQFDLAGLEKEMDTAVDRLRRDIKGLVMRVDRLTPALLDNIRVEEHGQRHPLQSYATVSVDGPEALRINIFDTAGVKAVEKALRESADLALNPQRIDETSLRVPIPRADMNTRQSLVKKASELSEAARIAIRAHRHQGQKDLKADQDNKVVGDGDARKDAKHLQDATKKRTDEVDKIFNGARKVLLDE